MTTDHASTLAPCRTGSEQLLAAVHAALGCPARELPGTAAICRAAISTALAAPDASTYAYLVGIVQRGTRTRGEVT